MVWLFGVGCCSGLYYVDLLSLWYVHMIVDFLGVELLWFLLVFVDALCVGFAFSACFLVSLVRVAWLFVCVYVLGRFWCVCCLAMVWFVLAVLALLIVLDSVYWLPYVIIFVGVLCDGSGVGLIVCLIVSVVLQWLIVGYSL